MTVILVWLRAPKCDTITMPVRRSCLEADWQTCTQHLWEFFAQLFITRSGSHLLSLSEHGVDRPHLVVKVVQQARKLWCLTQSCMHGGCFLQDDMPSRCLSHGTAASSCTRLSLWYLLAYWRCLLAVRGHR